jgi:hypothetical protein
LRRIRDNSTRSCRAIPRKRSHAPAAKSGRTWSPLKGLTITGRGPLQLQARIRRTGRQAQTKTFETVADAEAWGVGILDGFNRNTFVDRRLESRTTLGAILDRYLETGVAALKSRVQARSQVEQLRKSPLGQRIYPPPLPRVEISESMAAWIAVICSSSARTS